MNRKLSEEVKRKIKYIQIRTKRALNGTLLGDNTTAIKGTGLEFDQIRDYQVGDDVRFVDWKSSARTGKLLVKQYFEERSRDIIIAIDMSASTLFSSNAINKYDIMAQITSVLALVCDYAKDNVGVLIFSDKIVEFIRPAQGKFHVSNIMQKLFQMEVADSKTDINLALEYLLKNISKKSVIFLLSDFIDDNNFESNIKMIFKKHEFIAIRCMDTREQALPKIGLISMNDFETGQNIVLDLGRNSNKINLMVEEFIAYQNKMFKKYGVKLIEINNHKDYFSDLINCFAKLMMY